MTNILIQNDSKKNLKLIDFGFSSLNKKTFSTYCGTPSYMAPELVKKKLYDGILVDLWALGITLFKIVTGDYPFGSEKEKYLSQRILACDIKMPNYISSKCRNLIMSCLQQNPDDRISFKYLNFLLIFII